MNGYAADEQRPDDGKRPDRPPAVQLPLVPHDSRERDHCDRHGENGEQLDADRRGQGVVQDAVVHEAVAAPVPEVVPEHEAVLDEQRALVDVRGEIGSRRAEPDEQRGEEPGSDGWTEQVDAWAEPERSHQRMLPVCPREYLPGCGHTERP